MFLMILICALAALMVVHMGKSAAADSEHEIYLQYVERRYAARCAGDMGEIELISASKRLFDARGA